MAPHEPYWHTNSSFSPPHSRWDFRFHSERISQSSDDGFQFYASSASSNSRESRSLVRGNQVVNHPYYSSPSEISPAQQWTPPAIQEISADDYGSSRREAVSGPFSFSSIKEGPSATPFDCGGSTSSRSDSSDNEPTTNSNFSHRNFSNRRSFISKPIHPMTLPSRPSISTDAPDLSVRPFTRSDGSKCGLCDRPLSQRSPLGSLRIMRNSDMPTAGVLSCCHVFHVECLEKTTPKARRNDPPCPVCLRSEDFDWSVFSKMRNSSVRAPSHKSMVLLHRNRIKKNLSLKGNLIKEFPGNLRSDSYPSELLIG